MALSPGGGGGGGGWQCVPQVLKQGGGAREWKIITTLNHHVERNIQHESMKSWLHVAKGFDRE